jgi:acyl-CoA thioesterase-1
VLVVALARTTSCAGCRWIGAANLTAIIRAPGRGVTVIWPAEAPPSTGRVPTASGPLRDLAREHTLRFIPFLLDGVAGIASLNQADGIHPNAQGARRVADLVWDALEPALERPTPVAR